MVTVGDTVAWFHTWSDEQVWVWYMDDSGCWHREVRQLVGDEVDPDQADIPLRVPAVVMRLESGEWTVYAYDRSGSWESVDEADDEDDAERIGDQYRRRLRDEEHTECEGCGEHFLFSGGYVWMGGDQPETWCGFCWVGLNDVDEAAYCVECGHWHNRCQYDACPNCQRH